MAAENNIVGEVGLLVKPIDPNAQFQRGVDEMIRKLERQAQFQVKAAGMDQAQEAANGLSKSFAEAAIQAGAVTAAVYGIRAAIQGTIGKFQGMFDQLRKAQAGFASILKSDALGSSLLAQIQEFARVSPFVTQELVNYSQQLLGVGVSAQKIVPLLTSVGDIVSSVGGDTQNIGRVLFTLTQIQSIGRLAGQDAMQLQSALIPITKYMAEYLGKTTAEVKKLQEQGAISAESVFAAISAQGEKVKGAMASATRNIGGARAVLSDTIQIMLQNQPVLNKINDEIFKTILKLADTLGSKEFTQGFERFFLGVDKLYEGLKPLVGELAKLGGSTIIAGMGQTASFLSILGDVLQAIPEPLLGALARLLIVMATLKAPLMLVQYVQNIQRMSQALVPAVTNMARMGTTAMSNVAPLNAEAAAIDRVTAALTRRQRGVFNAAPGAGNKFSQFMANQSGKLAIGAALGGSYLSGGEGTGSQVAGSALTMGAMGFMLAGPAGGAAGAGIGALTSYLNVTETKAKAHVEEMKRLGREAATEFIETQTTEYGGATGASSNDFRAEYDRLSKEAEASRARIRELNDVRSGTIDTAFRKTMSVFTLGFSSRINSSGNELSDLNAELAGIEEQAKATEDAMTAAFEPFLIQLRQIVPLLDKSQAGYLGLTGSTGGGKGRGYSANAVITDDLEKVETTLKRYGLTLDDLLTKTPDQIEIIINTFDGLTTAQQNATREATEFNKAFTDAAAAAAAIFDPQQAQISSRLAQISAIKSAVDANISAGQNPGDITAQLTADNTALAAAENAHANAVARGATATEAAAEAERVYAQMISIRRIAEAASVTVTGQRIDDLIQLAGVADQLDNRVILVELVTNNIEAKIQQLLEYQLIAAQIEQGIYKPGGSRGGTLDPTKSVAEGGTGAQGRSQHDIDVLSGKIPAVSAYDKALVASNVTDPAAQAIADRDKAENDRIAAEALRLAEEAARQAEQWADAIETSTESMASAVQSAADAISAAADRWIVSIKERVQYEQAVSTGRLIRNTERQIGDLGELSSGMDNLRARGVTEEVLKALGIDNVADVRQVRKLVRSSDEDLARLTGLVGTLNQDAVALATKEEDDRTQKNIKEGIVAAAITLGYSKAEATAAVAQILPQFNITTASSPEEVAIAIISILTAGRVGL